MNKDETRKKEFQALQEMHQKEEISNVHDALVLQGIKQNEARFRALEEKSDQEVTKLVQAAHMLISLSMKFFSEAEDILEERGFALDRQLTKSQMYYNRAANTYCKEFAKMIKTRQESDHYWQNLQDIEKRVRKWSGLDKPDQSWYRVEDILPKPGMKVLVLTRNGKYGMSSTTQFGNSIEWKGSSNYTDSIVAWMPIPKYDL